MGTETAPTKRNRQRRVQLENANTMVRMGPMGCRTLNRTRTRTLILTLILMESSEDIHTRMVMTAMTMVEGLSRRYRVEVRSSPGPIQYFCVYYDGSHTSQPSLSLSLAIVTVKVTEEVALHLLDWPRTFS
jgi:hypothetical protein